MRPRSKRSVQWAARVARRHSWRTPPTGNNWVLAGPAISPHKTAISAAAPALHRRSCGNVRAGRCDGTRGAAYVGVARERGAERTPRCAASRAETPVIPPPPSPSPHSPHLPRLPARSGRSPATEPIRAPPSLPSVPLASSVPPFLRSSLPLPISPYFAPSLGDFASLLYIYTPPLTFTYI